MNQTKVLIKPTLKNASGDPKQPWYYEVVGGNGMVMATSKEYATRYNCTEGLKALRNNVGRARVIIDD